MHADAACDLIIACYQGFVNRIHIFLVKLQHIKLLLHDPPFAGALSWIIPHAVAGKRTS
jgi:hypothetical protein